MPRWLKSLLLALAIVWVAVVYAPYLRGIGPGTGGFLAGDLAVLAEAAGGAEISRTHAEPVPLQDMGARAYLAAGGERGSLLTGVSLALSRRLWGVSESSATLYRLENLLKSLLNPASQPAIRRFRSGERSAKVISGLWHQCGSRIR